MNTEEYQRRITGELLDDKTVHPLHIAPQMSWPLAQAVRLAARHPSRNEWGKKECIAIAKKIERAVTGKHPLPMIYRPAQLEPIMGDAELQEISLTMRELWLIVGCVHLAMRHPNMPATAAQIITSAAKQIEVRIVEAHPDAWMMIQMGWDERYDE